MTDSGIIDGSVLLCAAPPKATADDAVRILAEQFDLAGHAAPLSSERDQNFHVRGEDDREYVLKIANPAEVALTTQFQTSALLHVAARDAQIPVQRLIAARDGQYMPRVNIAGTTSTVRLLTFLPGKAQHLTVRSAAQRRAVAQCLARIDLALADFDHPGAHHKLIWDITHAGRMRGLLCYIADSRRRALATRFLENFDAHAAPMLPYLRDQVIHNDMNPHNILVRESAPDEVCGVLDFGDMVHAPLVNDVAVAASYETFSADNALGGVADFVAAYHAILPLTHDELSIVVDLVAARQVVTAAITEWRAARYPENRAYILRNNPSAWAGLENLATIDRKQAGAVMRRACGVH